MIEIAIISFGIGAVLGGLTFFGGYHIGYRYGLEAGYNEASRENERADELLDEIKALTK
jgi:hypothetical protein